MLQPIDLTTHTPGITTLQALEAELSGLLLDRADTVRAALVALLAR